MKYGSVCSGIASCTVAWKPLGWECMYYAERDRFASNLLEQHYPGSVNYGDFTTIEDAPYVDLIVGGTPCQAFSIGGFRKGMGERRGQLALEYIRLLDKARPTWTVWENVPGVLSSNKGRDFASFIGAMAEIGYSFSWRVLDAQHFGLPQRRHRVFLVGHIGDWRYPAAVLFERHSLQRHSPPSRPAEPEEGRSSVQDTYRMQGHGDYTYSQISKTIIANDYRKPTDLIVNHEAPNIRRLTLTEMERLQGFPDGYTKLKYKKAHEPRYRVLGNSIAVPVLRWIGERINVVQMVSEGSD